MNDTEHARTLLAAAEKDLWALNTMGDAQIFADEIFGFHAQQAIEKALKAWLAFLHQEYPLTHSLATLLARLEQQGCEVDRFQDLTFYTPFSVVFRYGDPGLPLPALDRPTVCSQVQRCFDHVQAVIEGSRAMEWNGRQWDSVQLVLFCRGDKVLAADILDYKSDALSIGDETEMQEAITRYEPQLASYRRSMARQFGLDAESYGNVSGCAGRKSCEFFYLQIQGAAGGSRSVGMPAR